MNDIDFSAETSIIEMHDLKALSRRVQLAIERRKFIDGVATGIAVMLAAAGVAAGAHVALSKVEAASSCPVCTCADASMSTSTSLADGASDGDSARSTSTSTSTLAALSRADGRDGRDVRDGRDGRDGRADSTDAADSADSADSVDSAHSTAADFTDSAAADSADTADTADTADSADVATASRHATAHRRRIRAPEKSEDLGLDEETLNPAAVSEVGRSKIAASVDEAPQSRLRAELALYDAAGRALSHGDFDAAASAAQTLRARYPDGPIAVEAGIVEVTALRDGNHREDARALLAVLRADSRAAAKSSTLDALAASLGVNAEQAVPEVKHTVIGARHDDDDNRILERHRADDREEP